MPDEWQFAVLLGILAAGGLLLFAASRKPVLTDVAEAEPKARVRPKRTTPKQRRKADENFRKHRGGGPR